MRSTSLAAFLLLLAVTSEASEAVAQQAQRKAIAVTAAGSCPSGPAVEAELPPLLRHHAVGRRSQTEELLEATIVEAGDAYEIRILRFSRVVLDASRDCAKRAQTAAVLVALAAEPLIESPPETSKQDAPRVEARPPPSRIEATSPSESAALQKPWLAAAVGAQVDLSHDGYGPAVGPLLGIAAGRGAWIAAISGAIFPEHRLGAAGASAGLTRHALDLKGGYALRLSSWELTAAFGVALDSLAISGGENGTQRRVDFGPTAALSLAYRTSRVHPFLQLKARWFPRDYKLIVLPQGEVGRTPGVYLGASAGLHLQIL